jgi:hypothetical protein
LRRKARLAGDGQPPLLTPPDAGGNAHQNRRIRARSTPLSRVAMDPQEKENHP